MTTDDLGRRARGGGPSGASWPGRPMTSTTGTPSGARVLTAGTTLDAAAAAELRREVRTLLARSADPLVVDLTAVRAAERATAADVLRDLAHEAGDADVDLRVVHVTEPARRPGPSSATRTCSRSIPTSTPRWAAPPTHAAGPATRPPGRSRREVGGPRRWPMDGVEEGEGLGQGGPVELAGQGRRRGLQLHAPPDPDALPAEPVEDTGQSRDGAPDLREVQDQLAGGQPGEMGIVVQGAQPVQHRLVDEPTDRDRETGVRVGAHRHDRLVGVSGADDLGEGRERGRAPLSLRDGGPRSGPTADRTRRQRSHPRTRTASSATSSSTISS